MALSSFYFVFKNLYTYLTHLLIKIQEPNYFKVEFNHCVKMYNTINEVYQ